MCLTWLPLAYSIWIDLRSKVSFLWLAHMQNPCACHMNINLSCHMFPLRSCSLGARAPATVLFVMSNLDSVTHCWHAQAEAMLCTYGT